ncbi:hypothetical protein [Mycolicibacterium sphagni]|uniref:PE domain-containing protein n=1 Tax=Mycolicibacterium sphagni TaxID=1786 RepID=A0ABX2K4S6_9MYCO|nr:hypothetical protein [Mycolicibacterium sphagni]NTY62056.1 hypothetical protein [Mycolicibacterium sphagni]
MDAIRNDVPQLETTSGGWSATAPSQDGIHPIPTPGMDAFSGAVTAAVGGWPAIHEEFVAGRVEAVGHLVAANGGTVANMTSTDAASTAQINGIEV